MTLLLLLVASSFAKNPDALEEAAPIPAPVPYGVHIEKIRHEDLPVNPRGQTDFTAYTLEWGEVRLGIGSVGLGIMPNMQVTTVPVLDAVGFFNGSGKIDIIEAGPLDLAVEGTYARVHRQAIWGTYVDVGGSASLELTNRWSIHGGGTWMKAMGAGEPQIDSLAAAVGSHTSADITASNVASLESKLAFKGQVTAVTAHAATDVRLNRRDSIILQGGAVVWSSGEMPTVAEGVVPDGTGMRPLADAYTLSAAWQLSWRYVDLRVGLGTSSVPGAWLMDTVDLSYRFGGETRVAERKMIQENRQARREAMAPRAVASLE